MATDHQAEMVAMLEDAREIAENILKWDRIWARIEVWKGKAKAAEEKVANIRALLQDVLVIRFEETGIKKHGAATYIERRGYEIDMGAALAWAKEKDMALALDEKAFKKLIDAGAVPPEIGHSFVVPSMRVASDLSAYFPPGEKTGLEDFASAVPIEGRARTELPEGYGLESDLPF